MDIFIDTSILYDDPFWQNSYNKVLLDRARKGLAKLYLSTIVTKELNRNYQKQIDEQLKKLNDASTTLNRKFTTTKIAIAIPSREKLIENFKSFYTDLVNENIINVIDFDTNYLTEIVDRAVWRKKPFTESKTELKDTIIWLSYSKYVNNNHLEKPYFLTTNINDFCKSITPEVKIFEVHDDLKADCDKFKIFKYTKDFVSEIVEKVEAENKSNFKDNAKEKINIEFVTKLIFNNYTNEVETEVSRHLEKFYDTRDIFNIDYFFTGYMETQVNAWGEECKDLQIDILDEYSIVSGYLELEIEVEAYEYNAGRDSGEDRHNYVGSKDIYTKAFFSFSLDTNFVPENFEITDVKVEK